MRIKIKVVTNNEELKVNDYERQLAVQHNVQNRFNPIPLPKKVSPKYKETIMGIRQDDIVDFWIDVNKSKDIRINHSSRGELVCVYDPLLESKLEQIFKFE